MAEDSFRRRNENTQERKYHSGGQKHRPACQTLRDHLQGFPHGPKRRLIKKILYGIQGTKDVKFSNINRSLNEQQSLIKTEDRFLRNLDDMDFTDGMNHQVGRLGTSKVREKMVIAYIELRNEVLLALTVRFCRGMRRTEPEVEDTIGASLLGI